MNRKLIIPKNIITVNPSDEFLTNTALEIKDGLITKIADVGEFNLPDYGNNVFRFPSFTLIPGFVQTHVHLCQVLFRGLADDLLLLDWLQQRIFPYENAHDENSIKVSAELGIHELQTSGTTTILDMGTINHQEIIFNELINSTMRGFAGKCLMDENGLYSSFKESTDLSLKTAHELADTFHGSNNGKIKYAFAPRFVLSCSERLMKESYEMMKDFSGSLYETHASENKAEIEAVRKKKGMENIEYFNSIGVLGENTVLAHCIHVNDNERNILKSTNTRVAHCPSANLKLGSGIAPIPKYIEENISVSLGADGAPCNNNLSAFTEMRHSALIQKPVHGPTSMDAKTVFKLATIGGAEALHLGNEIGSIEVGKKADLVLLDLERVNQPLLDEPENIYSAIVYSAGRENVKEVMIEGEWIVRDGKSAVYDEKEIYETGKLELRKLLGRV
ncbi:amidohydrolase family protein [Bacteroidota bacterium]